MNLFSFIKESLRSKVTEFPVALPQHNEEELVMIEGIKYNLGCGYDVRPGWVNIDLHERHHPDIVADVTNLAMIEDETGAYVLAQDILEHIHRDRCISTLQEWNRILKVDGLLELRVPDIQAIARLMSDDRYNSLEGHRAMIHCLFGTQGYQGDYHYNGFTEISLTDDLKHSGFEMVRLRHFDEWLFEVVAKKVEHNPPDKLLRLPSNERFLAEAYRRELQREVDESGMGYFTSLLEAGTPREVVIKILQTSDEGKSKSITDPA